MHDEYKRRPPRLERLFQRYSQPVYFVTFVTRNRRRILDNSMVHEAFSRFGQRALEEFDISIGRYVIMPEHVHLFVRGGHDFELGRWVGNLKQAMAKAVPTHLGEGSIWQEGFVDHVMRHTESMSKKWNYIFQNPVRANLVSKAEDWPYQGEIVPIMSV